jgi:predicted DNA-binding transcriptional regulator AlpA
MAQMWGFHVNTLDNLRKRNEGPPTVRIGRSIRYPRESAREYLEAQQQQ